MQGIEEIKAAGAINLGIGTEWVVFAILAVSIVANAMSFGMFAADKGYAIAGKRRIPESKLIKATWFGAFGAFLGMRIVRHKTLKPKFAIGVPIILLVKITGAVVLIWLFSRI